ncbi:DUF1672 domain-containing protein [Staphylococcus caprae]|uniref:DUF1672 domain-containing protein n=1 Tax=Staphylococcus caprae TaxID=29380 RepID=UPI000E69E8CC|nr:DUF1672 domain-containing protein [Staphylococcus caprae]RIM32854.1 DUF1672 domain-containing protein [Staphylococcus caprae]
MKKNLCAILALSLLLFGCSTIDHHLNKTSQSVPEEMPASKYVGQGFQPKAEKSAIEYAKKHRKEYEKLGEQFFKDNFSLNVKATNVVGSGDGVEVFVHCDDHDIVFNARIPFDKESIHEKGSMRSHDNGDDMSTMVGTVLSGFEYRAQKEKYDNLTRTLKENQSKYQYTGYTKDAIYKTQNTGYQNEFYYISADLTSLKNYRKYFEPIIKKNDKKFKEGVKNAYKSTNYEAKIDVVTTLFSTMDSYSKKKNTNNVFKLAKDIENSKGMPNNIDMDLQFTDENINTVNPLYSKKDVTNFGVFDEYK